MKGFSQGHVNPIQPSEFKSLAEVQQMAHVEAPPIDPEAQEEAAEGQGMGFGLDADDGGTEM